MIELAALPALLLIAALAGLGWLPTLTLLALPVGRGVRRRRDRAGGLGDVARGRDASCWST